MSKNTLQYGKRKFSTDDIKHGLKNSQSWLFDKENAKQIARQYIQASEYQMTDKVDDFTIQLWYNLQLMYGMDIITKDQEELETNINAVNAVIKTLFEMVEGKIDTEPRSLKETQKSVQEAKEMLETEIAKIKNNGD